MTNGRFVRSLVGWATVLAVSAALACSGSTGGGRVWFVDEGAAAGGDGRSWTSAAPDLQAVLALSRAGDEIWVARGVYTPGPAGVSSAAREVNFALRDGVRLYGGFAGGETARSQRDPAGNRTVLSGDLARNDAADLFGTRENAYQVVTALHVGPATVLDGFTVSGGRADGPGFGAVPESREQGSGLNVYHSSPRIEGCVFEDNWSLNHGAINDHGEDTLVVGCTFRRNRSAAFGAGLYVHHHSRTRAVACTFEDNEAFGEGGGAYSRSMEGASFIACTFRGNRAKLGAGLYVAMEGTTRVEDCEFRDNIAEIGGGGVYGDMASPEVRDCVFERNFAGLGATGGGGGGGGSGGGGFWATGGTPIVEHCTFRENQASFGGGAYFIEESSGTVSDCNFEENEANEAGGLYTLESAVRVERCRFARNVAHAGSFPVGGGVSNYFSDSEFLDCTFLGNRAELGGGGLYSEGASPRVVHCVFFGNEAFGSTQGWGGGIMNGYFTASLIADCAFSGNVAHQGGGVFNIAFSAPTLSNCTLAFDVADVGNEVHALFETSTLLSNCIVLGADLAPIGGEPIEVRYSLVRGGYPGEGNVDADPLLVRLPSPGPDALWGTVDDDLGDLAPAPGSPCVDAGDNAAVPEGILEDLAGAPRFKDDPTVPDTGLGSPPLVDLGAYER